MSRSYQILTATLCITFGFLAVGCKDDGTSPPTGPKYLVGHVHDEQGNPVQDVGIHYIFTMDTLSHVQQLDSPPPTITLRYVLSQTSHVNLKILRWYTEELIMTAIDTEQSPGIHSVTFDGTQMTNGVYLYRLSIGDSVTEGRIVMVYVDLGELVTVRPLVTSNAQGQFSIPNKLFGLGIPFVRTSPSGEVLDTAYISPAIQMVLHKDGYQTLVQSVVIDPSRDLTTEFVLRR